MSDRRVETPGLSISRPLTSIQKSMALASMRAPHKGAYIIQDICEFHERLNVDHLRSAWIKMTERHGILRTTIEVGAAGLTQCPQALCSHQWTDLDWTHFESVDQDAMLDEYLISDRKNGFDFVNGAPFRITLIKREESAFILILTAHHALLDGRSLQIIWREWLHLYDVDPSGYFARLPDIPSFSAHLDFLATYEPVGSESYWRDHLDGLTQTTGFLVDRFRLRSEERDSAQFKERIQLSQAETVALQEFARDHDLTIETLTQAAWAVVLSRYSGNREIVFGVTRSGRHSVPDADQIAGVFINTLPLRVNATPEEPVIDFLRKLRTESICRRPFEHVPTSKIWECCNLPESLMPFDSVVVYDHQTLSEVSSQWGQSWKTRRLRREQRTDVPLTLAAYGSPVITLDVIYDSARYTKQTVEGVARYLKTILNNLVQHSGTNVGDLEMLPADEMGWLINGLNATESAIPEVCVHRLFQARAHEMPDATALEWADGRISYGQLNQETNRLAALLRERGVTSGDVVAICLNESYVAAQAVFATLKAGGTFLLLDNQLPLERIGSMLLDSNAKFVLVNEATANCVTAGSVMCLKWDEIAAKAQDQSSKNLDEIATPETPAYLVYTSGSTGTPNGVVVSHRSAVNFALAAAAVYGIGPNDRRLQFVSQSGDVFIAEMLIYLSAGAALVFSPNRFGGSMAGFLRILDQQSITITGMPSSWWHEWVSLLANGGPLPSSSLRAVIVGMERVSPEAFATWRRHAPSQIRWFNVYGPAECAGFSTIYESGTSAWESGPGVPIGKLIMNARAYVLDERGHLLPPGQPGELFLGGVGLALCYKNAPELTARKFIENPLRCGDKERVYRTGDLVYWLPDGNLVFTGRSDSQVKVRGFRVELEEVEAILGRHPAIQQCAVTFQGGILAAYFTVSHESDPTLEQLRAHASRYMPMHMIPASFTRVERLPLTPSGKVNRQELGNCATTPLKSDRPVTEPNTSLEKRLRLFFAEALDIKGIKIDDDFFEMGGDSLRATVLLGRIHDNLDIELSLDELYRMPTVAKLAEWLEGGSRDSTESETAIRVEHLRSTGSAPPLFCISTASDNPWMYRTLAKQLSADQPFFAIANPLRPGVDQTVPVLGKQALATIRQIRPHGPYVIGGACLGALIAHEVVHQLCAEGEQVRLLIMFDAWIPSYPQLLRVRTFQKYWQILRETHAKGFDIATFKRHAQAFVRMLNSRRRETTKRLGIGQHNETSKGDVAYAAVRRHRAPRIPVRIVHLSAQTEWREKRLLGDLWQDFTHLTDTGYEHHVVPGSHTSMFHVENIKLLGSKLSDLLGPL